LSTLVCETTCYWAVLQEYVLCLDIITYEED